MTTPAAPTVTAKLYGLAQQGLVSGDIDWLGATLKVMLCTVGYTPNQDLHRYKSDVNNEVTGTNYIAGGQTVTGLAQAYDTATNRLSLTCDNVLWADSTITARHAVWYLDTGTATTSQLLVVWTFSADVVSSAGPFGLSPGGALVTLETP
jgi:hypothetical protein